MKNEIMQPEKLTLNLVKKAIYSWDIRFPEGQRPSTILDFLSAEYFEDLQSENVNAGQFMAACSIVRKQCRWFPKMADILDAVKSVGDRGECAKCIHRTTAVCVEKDEARRKNCKYFENEPA